MTRIFTALLLIASLTLSACASIPSGPSAMALPGSGKSFDQFRFDDFNCREFARQQVGGTPEQAERDAAIKSAVIGTILGAAAGAAIGSASGDMGAGAAIGGGSGLLIGSAYGTGYASSSRYEAQRRYDHAYLQCMYAMGHRIPVHGSFIEPSGSAPSRWEAPPGYPPPDYPPPPPR